MDGVQHNADELAGRYAVRADAIAPGVRDALDDQARLIASRLAGRVAKFRSTTALSMHVENVSEFERFIGPGTEYAYYIDRGVKPGGKGLPRFFDPASVDIVAWLQTKLRGSARSPARGSKAFQSAEIELRNRYEGLAWHVRHFGVKAQPFIEPTAQELAAPVAAALRAAFLAAATGASA
jgi:hypothetical protein